VNRLIAFLRGVNLGGRTVKGPQLISAFSALGLKNVATFLASGNVVFDTSRKNLQTLQVEIESRLAADLGFETRTFLRSMNRISEIAGANPFGLSAKQGGEFTTHVIFLDGKAPKAMKDRMIKLRSDYDDFAFDCHEAFWLCRGPKISESKLFQGTSFEKAVSAPNTMRNIRTIQRLVAKFGRD